MPILPIAEFLVQWFQSQIARMKLARGDVILDVSPSHGRHAFTLIELLLVLSAIGLLAGLILGEILNAKAKAAMASCASNMRQVSRGFISWVNDSQRPAVPWRLDAADGGTKNHQSGLQNNAWFQYSWISNELPNPRVLACPSDKHAKPAETFTASPRGGFLHPSNRNEACSYIIGIDVGSIGQIPPGGGGLLPFELTQEHALLWDRNSDTSRASSGSCSSGLDPIYSVSIGRSQWLRNPHYGHGSMGNVGLCDGSVHRTGQREFNEIITKADDSSSPHCLLPRPTP